MLIRNDHPILITERLKVSNAGPGDIRLGSLDQLASTGYTTVSSGQSFYTPSSVYCISTSTSEITFSSIVRTISSGIDTVGFAGTLTPGSGQSKLVWPFPIIIVSIRAAVGTAPTGSDAIVDVNLDGASMFTTQANRPRITAGSTIGALTAPDITAVAAGQAVTVDIDQIGSSVAGSDLTVLIERA
jgi:hypothetical protein